MLKFVPTPNRILVQKVGAPQQTESGLLLIPESAQKEPVQESIVVAMHPSDSDFYGVGSRVYHGQYAGHPIKLGKTDFLILLQEEVWGFLEEIPEAQPTVQ